MARLKLTQEASLKELGALISQAATEFQASAVPRTDIENQIAAMIEAAAMGRKVRLEFHYDRIEGEEYVVNIVIPLLDTEHLPEVGKETLGQIVILGCGN